jgi:glycerol-3-phosphate dehydrogenase
MSGKLGIQMHKRLGAKKALEMAPALKPEGMTTALMYYDGQTDDTLLTMTVLRTAAKHGALLANYTELLGFEQDARSKLITAAKVRDVLTGHEYVIKAKQVINAGGVFAGRIEAIAANVVGGESQIQIKPAKGVHLTVPREAVPIGEHAVVLPETPDNRLIFLVPWNTRVTIGTTDTKGGDIDQPKPTADDVQYLLDVTNDYLKTKLTKADIISSWAGYRPLISPANSKGDTSKLSRTHVVNDGPGGMITITGGKLTTYRRMAQDTVDHMAKRDGQPIQHATEEMLLDGAQGFAEANRSVDEAAPRLGWNADVVHRVKEYGSEACRILDICNEDKALAQPIVPDLPYTFAEVVYACRHEMAMNLQDMIVRRLHLNFEDWSRGVTPAPAIAKVMAQELGWSEGEVVRQVAQYRAFVESETVN